MTRRITCFLTLLGIALIGPLASGCHSHKHRVIERSETIQESEPHMVSPGKEKVE